MVYPDYQRVDDKKVNKFFEKFWDTKLDDKPGLTVVEIMDEITKGVIKGLYVMGENPAMSDPDLNHARKALSKLEHLVVQDIFLTETAMYADIILPASAFPEKTGARPRESSDGPRRKTQTYCGDAHTPRLAVY